MWLHAKKVSFGKVPKLCIQRNSSKLTKRQRKAHQRLNPPQSGSSFLKTNASSTIGPRSVGGDRSRSPGGLLPLRGRVRIQHPRRLASMFGLRSCRLRWAPLSKYSHSFGCSPESQTWNRDLSHSLPVGSVLRCPPPVRKTESERARALERKRERDGKEFGNQDRSRCHQDAKWKQKTRRLFCAADNVSWEQLVRSSRSHIKCHHDLTTFLLLSSFFRFFFVRTKKKLKSG